MTAREVAALVGCTPQHVRRAMRDGHLLPRGVTLSGVRFHVDDVWSWRLQIDRNIARRQQSRAATVRAPHPKAITVRQAATRSGHTVQAIYTAIYHRRLRVRWRLRVTNPGTPVIWLHPHDVDLWARGGLDEERTR